MEKVILVLGGAGRLGSHLIPHLRSKPDWRVVSHSHSQPADVKADLSHFKEVKDLVEKVQPDFIINLVALTDVDLCEKNKYLANSLNVLPVQNLVRSIQDYESKKPHLIQISTDQVYDGDQSTETDVKPKNHYAATKLMGDELAMTIDSLVLRTNFFGASLPGRLGFSDWALEKLRSNTPLQGFSDVYFSPLFSKTLCEEITNCILNFNSGVFNLGSHQGLSKYEFILKIAEFFKLDASFLKPVKYADLKLDTPRPRDMRMNVEKYESTFGRKLPALNDEIRKCLA